MKKIIFLVTLSICICSFVFAQSQKELFGQGVEFLKLGKAQEAVETFTMFIELDPDNAYVYKNRGVAFMRLKEYDIAIKDFEKAKSILPRLNGIHSNLGVAWYCKKEYEKAIENYSIELNRTPEDASLLFNRALCYAELDEDEKGVADLSRALKLKPDFHLALCFKGDLLMKLERSEQAKKAYEDAVIITHAKEKIKQIKQTNLTKPEAGTIKKNRLKSNPKPKKESKMAAESKGNFAIQVGAFQNREYALELDKKLARNGYDSRILRLKGRRGKVWHLVRVGLFSKPEKAEQLILSLKEKMSLNDAITRPAGAF